MPTLRLIIDALRAKTGARTYRSAVEKDVIGTSRTAARAVGGVDKSMVSLGNTARGVGRQLATVFGGVAVVAGLRAATRTIAQFEETMAQVRGVTGATESQFAKLVETASKLGATTRFTASEAGEGLLFLSRAGFEASEAIEALPATLNLAIAGVLELGEAADFASNILQQFQLPAEQMVRIVDTLTKTANSSNTNVRQLAEAMKFAGPIAGTMGRQVEETAAAVGVLGDAGIQASLAGTNLRGVMLALTGPTKEAERVLATLGVSLESIDPSRYGLVEIFSKLGRAQLTAADATDIFGRRNAAAALILASNADKLAELEVANRNASGEAQKLADIVQNTLAGSFRSLKSAAEAVVLATAEGGLAGTLKTIVDLATLTLRALAGMEVEMSALGVTARVLAFSLEAAAVALLSLTAGAAVKGLIALKNAFLAYTAAVQAATIASRSLTAGFLVATPWGALAVAVGAVVVGIYKLGQALTAVSQQTREFRKSLDDVGDAMVKVRNAQFELRRATILGEYERRVKLLQQVVKEHQEEEKALRKSAEAAGASRESLADLAKRTQTSVEDLKQLPGVMDSLNRATDLYARQLNKVVAAMSDVELEAFQVERVTLSPETVKSIIEQLKDQAIAARNKAEQDLAQEELNLRPKITFPDLPQELTEQLERVRKLASERGEEVIALRATLELPGLEEGNVALAQRAAVLRAESVAIEDHAKRYETLETALAKNTEEYNRLNRAQKLLLLERDTNKRITEEQREILSREIATIQRKKSVLNEEQSALLERVRTFESVEEATKRSIAATEAEFTALREKTAELKKLQRAAADPPSLVLFTTAFRTAYNLVGEDTQKFADELRSKALGAFADFVKAVDDFAKDKQLEATLSAQREELELINTLYEEGTAAITNEKDAQLELAAILSAINALRKANKDVTAENVREILSQTRAIENLNAALRGGRGGGGDKPGFDAAGILAAERALRRQNRMLQAEGEAREMIAAQIERRELAEQFGADLDDPRQAAAIDKLMTEIKLNEELSDAEQERARNAQLAADVTFDLLNGIVIEGRNASEVIRDLAQNLAQMALRLSLEAGFRSLFGVQGSAKGNVFRGGEIVPFQFGGVINQPTVFPLAGQNLGVAGESGPEGILPLGRDSQGRLGVRMIGGSERSITVQMNFPSVRTKADARGFRTTVTQAMEDVEGRSRRTRFGV